MSCLFFGETLHIPLCAKVCGCRCAGHLTHMEMDTDARRSSTSLVFTMELLTRSVRISTRIAPVIVTSHTLQAADVKVLLKCDGANYGRRYFYRASVSFLQERQQEKESSRPPPARRIHRAPAVHVRGGAPVILERVIDYLLNLGSSHLFLTARRSSPFNNAFIYC